MSTIRLVWFQLAVALLWCGCGEGLEQMPHPKQPTYNPALADVAGVWRGTVNVNIDDAVHGEVVGSVGAEYSENVLTIAGFCPDGLGTLRTAVQGDVLQWHTNVTCRAVFGDCHDAVLELDTASITHQGDAMTLTLTGYYVAASCGAAVSAASVVFTATRQ